MVPVEHVTKAAELASRIQDELIAVRGEIPNGLIESTAALHDDLNRYADQVRRRGQHQP
jgi:hypothetical protein